MELTRRGLYLFWPFCLLFVAVFGVTGGSYIIASLVIFSLILMIAVMRISPPPRVALQKILPFEKKAFIIAHRGAMYDAPENTLAAVRQAIENGATAVKFGVSYTVDGVPVVFQDQTLERCTDGTGEIADKTMVQLRAMSASCKHANGHLYPDERVPTLEEMISLCIEKDVRMYISIKGYPPQAIESFIELFYKFPKLLNLAVVCSHNPRLVYAVRRLNPQIVGGISHRSGSLTREASKAQGGAWYMRRIICPLLDSIYDWSQQTWIWFIVGNSVFLSHHTDVSLSSVDYYRRRGIQVVVYTVNERGQRGYYKDNLHCPVVSDTMNEMGCPAVN